MGEIRGVLILLLVVLMALVTVFGLVLDDLYKRVAKLEGRDSQ